MFVVQFENREEYYLRKVDSNFENSIRNTDSPPVRISVFSSSYLRACFADLEVKSLFVKAMAAFPTLTRMYILDDKSDGSPGSAFSEWASKQLGLMGIRGVTLVHCAIPGFIINNLVTQRTTGEIERLNFVVSQISRKNFGLFSVQMKCSGADICKVFLSKTSEGLLRPSITAMAEGGNVPLDLRIHGVPDLVVVGRLQTLARRLRSLKMSGVRVTGDVSQLATDLFRYLNMCDLKKFREECLVI